jgi:integrase
MAHVETYRLRDGTKRYRARWDGPDGRPRSRSFVLKKDAERFVLEQRRRASLGVLYQAPPETLGEFLAGWLDRYSLRVRPSTLARVRQVLPHVDAFARFALDEIHPAAVEDHVAGLARRAPRQAELALRVLKQVLANAKERGHLVDESVFRVKAPRREQPEMRFLDWHEVQELAANTVAPYGNLVQLAALTGLRQGELFALRDRNVDLDAMTLQVEHGAYRGELVPVKTRASRRRVDLSSTAAHVLRRQLLARKPNDRRLVFPSPRGELLNDDNFRHRVFRPAVRRSGLIGLRFHDLRHTYAALMVAAGAHPKYLQAQMGHSSIRVTLDLYGHLFPDANRGVLASLDALTAPSTPHRANAAKTTPKGKVPVTRDLEDGSDGTRTRDLRRDRPAFRPLPRPRRQALSYWRTGCRLLGKLLGHSFCGARNRLTKPDFGLESAEIAPRRSPVRVRLAPSKPPQIGGFLLGESA